MAMYFGDYKAKLRAIYAMYPKVGNNVFSQAAMRMMSKVVGKEEEYDMFKEQRDRAIKAMTNAHNKFYGLKPARDKKGNKVYTEEGTR